MFHRRSLIALLIGSLAAACCAPLFVTASDPAPPEFEKPSVHRAKPALDDHSLGPIRTKVSDHRRDATPELSPSRTARLTIPLGAPSTLQGDVEQRAKPMPIDDREQDKPSAGDSAGDSAGGTAEVELAEPLTDQPPVADPGQPIIYAEAFAPNTLRSPPRAGVSASNVFDFSLDPPPSDAEDNEPSALNPFDPVVPADNSPAATDGNNSPTDQETKKKSDPSLPLNGSQPADGAPAETAPEAAMETPPRRSVEDTPPAPGDASAASRPTTRSEAPAMDPSVDALPIAPIAPPVVELPTADGEAQVEANAEGEASAEPSLQDATPNRNAHASDAPAMDQPQLETDPPTPLPSDPVSPEESSRVRPQSDRGSTAPALHPLRPNHPPRSNLLAPRTSTEALPPPAAPLESSDSNRSSASESPSYGSAPAPAPTPRQLTPPPSSPRVNRVQQDQGQYRVTMNLRDEDLRGLLDFLSKEAELNLLASENVKGSVTASFSNVRVEEALDAILRMTGFVGRREGDFLFVGTPQDLEKMAQLHDVVETKIYRTNYVTAAELQQLITPMLTEGVGVVTVSTASQVDIPSDSVVTGGDNFAGNEVILVRDYRRVLARIDSLVREVDQRPRQVVIEAMILSVNLDDSHRFGINFELFRNDDNVRLTSGSPLGSLGQIDVSNGGLSFGVLNTDVGGFVDALETIGDTNVIAAPRLLCLNKQRAEILIGDQKGFISTTQTETSTTQTVEFLDIGTQLRIRPFISDDGVIRLEVHPELSTGDVKLLGGFALPEKSVTQVTTNIMCRDGATVVIGGLIREDFSHTGNQVAGLGSLPVVGGLLRNTNESVARNEIVVLITPRVVHDPAEMACETPDADFFARQAEAESQRISPIARRHYSDRYYRLAYTSWTAGNGVAALKYVHLALKFNPRSHKARKLLEAMTTGGGFESLHVLPTPVEGIRIDEADGHPSTSPGRTLQPSGPNQPATDAGPSVRIGPASRPYTGPFSRRAQDNPSPGNQVRSVAPRGSSRVSPIRPVSFGPSR